MAPELGQNKLPSAMYPLTDTATPSPVLIPFTVWMLLLEEEGIAKPLRTQK